MTRPTHALAPALCCLLLASGCQGSGADDPSEAVTTTTAGRGSVSVAKGEEVTLGPAVLGATAVAGLTTLLDRGIAVGTPLEVGSGDDASVSTAPTVARSWSEPLPEGASATVLAYDRVLGGWYALPSTVADDRRSVTAHLPAPLPWTDAVLLSPDELAGWEPGVDAPGDRSVLATVDSYATWAAAHPDSILAPDDSPDDDLAAALATGAEAPASQSSACEQGVPGWVSDDVAELGDLDGAAAVCVGHERKRPELLSVTITVRRGWGAVLSLGAAPTSSETPYATDVVDAVADAEVDVSSVVGVDADAPDHRRQVVLNAGERATFAFAQGTVAGLEDGPLVSLKPATPQTLVVGALTRALSETADLPPSAARAVATVVAARCAESLGPEGRSGAASAALDCLASRIEDLAQRGANAIVRGELAEGTGGEAGPLTALASVTLALLGDQVEDGAFGGEVPATAVATVSATATPPAATETILVNPIGPDGRVKDGWEVSDQGDSVDCGYDPGSPVAVSAGTHSCGGTADNAFACWDDPRSADAIYCLWSPWERTLRRLVAEPRRAQPPPDDPDPFGIELTDGSWWWYRIGGAWSQTYSGTFPAYGCYADSGCRTDEAIVTGVGDSGENEPLIDTTNDVWTVRVSLMDDSAPDEIPVPEVREIARVWYITTGPTDAGGS